MHTRALVYSAEGQADRQADLHLGRDAVGHHPVEPDLLFSQLGNGVNHQRVVAPPRQAIARKGEDRSLQSRDANLLRVVLGVAGMADALNGKGNGTALVTLASVAADDTIAIPPGHRCGRKEPERLAGNRLDHSLVAEELRIRSER